MAAALAGEPVHRLCNLGWIRALDPFRDTHRDADRLLQAGRELRLPAAGVLSERTQDRDRTAVRRLVRIRHLSQGNLGIPARIFSRCRGYGYGLQVDGDRNDRSRPVDARFALANVSQVQPSTGAPKHLQRSESFGYAGG